MKETWAERQDRYYQNVKKDRIKEVMPILNDPFTDAAITLDLMAMIMRRTFELEAQGKSTGQLLGLLHMVQTKFTALSTSQVLHFFRTYTREESKLVGKRMRYPFSLLVAIGGCVPNDIGHARNMVSQMKQMLMDATLGGPEKETHDLTDAVRYIMSVINLQPLFWEVFLANLPQDRDAQRIFGVLLRLLSVTGVNAVEVVIADEWKPFQQVNDFIETAFITKKVLTIPVERGKRWIVKQTVETLWEQMNPERIPLIELMRDFEAHIENHMEFFDYMWQQVSQRGSYDVREAGLDYVVIDESRLQKGWTKYHRIQFIREGSTFPAVQAVYHLTMGQTPKKMVKQLEPKPLIEYVERMPDGALDSRHLVDMYLVYLAMWCYWRIVMGEDQKGSWDIRKSGGSLLNEQPMVHRVMRPRFRRLPQGHKASVAAIDRSMSTFRKPPPEGRTFVKQHDRGFACGNRDLQLEVRPVFRLKEQDLLRQLVR